LHFLIGLNSFIRDLVLTAECSCSSIDSFIQEAKKYSKAIKEEPIEPEVKLEIEEKVKKLDESLYINESYDFDSEFDEQTEKASNEWTYDNYSSSRELKTHGKKVHSKVLNNSNETVKKTCCPIWNETFDTKLEKTNHDEALHSHVQKSCETCHQVFPYIRALAQHIAKYIA